MRGSEKATVRVPFHPTWGLVGEGSSVLEACVEAFAAVRATVSFVRELLGRPGFGLDSKRPALRLLLPLRGTRPDRSAVVDEVLARC